jgi:hypothetical protein
MADLVNLNNAVFKLQQENQELKQHVVDLASAVKIMYPIVRGVYNGVSSTSNVSEMYGFLEVAIGNVITPPPVNTLPSLLQ